VLRDRQHLVAIESIETRLVLTMLRFADEVVDVPELAALDRVKVASRDLQLATNLIAALATEWKPEQYKDDYQKNLQEVIKSKMKGETVVLESEEQPMGAEVIDLAERLRASLKAAQRNGRGRRTNTAKAASKTRANAARPKTKRKPAA
jgi:DNA end-binding protein Ku